MKTLITFLTISVVTLAAQAAAGSAAIQSIEKLLPPGSSMGVTEEGVKCRVEVVYPAEFQPDLLVRIFLESELGGNPLPAVIRVPADGAVSFRATPGMADVIVMEKNADEEGQQDLRSSLQIVPVEQDEQLVVDIQTLEVYQSSVPGSPKQVTNSHMNCGVDLP